MHPIEEQARESCRKITDVYLLVMLTAYPLFTGLGGYTFLHRKKFLFFVFATLLWLACLLTQTVRRLLHGGQFSRPRLPELLSIAFLAAATLSTLLSPHAVFFSLRGRYEGLLTHILYIAILMGLYRYGRLRQRFLYAFAAAYTVCCALALLQLLGVNPLRLFPEGVNYYDPCVQENGKFLSTIGNIDLLAALHCLALPLLLAALLRGTGRLRFALLLPLSLGAVCLVWEDVAAGVVAVGLTALLFLPGACAEAWEERTGRRARAWLRYLGPALLLAALTALFFLPVPDGSAREIQRVLHGELEDSFGSHRVLIWRKVLEVVRAHPLFGVGPDSLWAYLDIRFERWSELLNEQLVRSVDHAHSEYLQLLAAFGVVGALPLLSLAVCTARYVLRAGDKTVNRCLVPCLFCYLVQACFSVSFCIVTPFACIVWGLALSRCAPPAAPEPSEESKEAAP